MKVSWISLHDDILNRGTWDNTILDLIFDGTRIRFDHVEQWGGQIITFPGRHHTNDFDKIQERIKRQPEIVVVVAGDEEGVFPWWDLQHANMRLWVQHPRRWWDRTFGVGPTPHTWTAGYTYERSGVYFSGQVTHKARHDLVASLRNMPEATVNETSGFTEGDPPEEYIAKLSRAKLAPAPSGPVLADTFRLYEALENGCFPIVDDDPPHGEPGYWNRVYGDVPFPVVDWSHVTGEDWERWSTGWPANANRAGSWWQQQKLDLSRRFRTDLTELFDVEYPDEFTVLIVTSPIPTHPDTKIIDETVGSIRERIDAPMVICADGVRSEQEHLRGGYEDYLHRIMWKAGREWDATVVRFDKHVHQAEMTRRTLQLVDTPSVLFLEHDTPLVGEVPGERLARITSTGTVNVIRLLHEAQVLSDHHHLIEGSASFDGVDLIRTTQWSQRPHFANTGYYRRILADYFRVGSNTMIEDRMHGVVQSEPWGAHRVAIYAPGGNMKRSTHLDARGTEPKFEETFKW